MTAYTRDALVSATGRWAANRRHHPDRDNSQNARDVVEAKAGYYLQNLRSQYPGVSLTEDQVDRLLEVLR